MASNRNERSARKVGGLKPEGVSGKKAKAVKGGGIYMNLDSIDGSVSVKETRHLSWIDFSSN